MLIKEKSNDSLCLNSGVLEKVILKYRGNDIKILLALCLKLDTVGYTEISVTKLSEELGISINTISNFILSMCRIGFLTMEKGSNNDVINLCIQNNVDITSSKKIIRTKVESQVSAKSLLIYYMKKYLEQYNVVCSVNYARDMSLIKKSIISKYDLTEEEFCSIIDLAFSLYDAKWKSVQYDKLTIGALCSFIFADCYARYKKEVEYKIETNVYNEDHTDLF